MLGSTKVFENRKSGIFDIPNTNTTNNTKGKKNFLLLSSRCLNIQTLQTSFQTKRIVEHADFTIYTTPTYLISLRRRSIFLSCML